MFRDLINPLLLPEPSSAELQERETAQLLNPVGFDPFDPLLSDDEVVEEAA
jgi:hypothetical protein